MWALQSTDLYTRRSRKFEKRYPREWSEAVKNVARYHEALVEGAKPLQIIKSHSFVHTEKRGVYAVDQGKGKALAQIRLYLYPDLEHQKLYLLTIGDKQSQPNDIQDCYVLVDDIIKNTKQEESNHDDTEKEENPEQPEGDEELH